jgi:hypothetical protein
VGLRGQIDDDAALGVFGRGLEHQIEALEAVDRDRRGVAGVEAQQGAVAAVGIEAQERQLAVDQILRQQARHQRLADAAFFPADEVNRGH